MVFIKIVSEFFLAGSSSIFFYPVNGNLTLLFGGGKDGFFHAITGDFTANGEHIIRCLNEIEFLFGFSAKFSQFLLGFDDVLNCFMGKLESFNKTVLGDLISGSFDHHHLLFATHINKVEGGVIHLFVGRIDHKFSVNLTKTDTSDWTIPWNV